MLVLGVMCGITIGAHWRISKVHAQEQYSSVGGYLASVPKSWGEFRGASDFGMVFEVQDGTLWVVQHPTCGNLSSEAIPDVKIDLKVQRR